MSGIIIFLVFTVPTPSCVFVDAATQYNTGYESITERFGAYYEAPNVFSTERSRAVVYSHRWKAELKAMEIRKLFNDQDYSYWVRVVRVDQIITTFHERQTMIYSGEHL